MLWIHLAIRQGFRPQEVVLDDKAAPYINFKAKPLLSKSVPT